MTRILKIVAAWLLGLVVVGAIGMVLWIRSLHASAAPEALAAMQSDAEVQVEADEWLVFRPAGREPVAGVILYPGAACDDRGYAPLLRRIAAAGYLVVEVPMPLEFALFAPDRALDVMAAFPQVQRWTLVGHSMGGAIGGVFAAKHRDRLAGLIFWDAYPASSLADWDRPVWLIHRAHDDGSPPAKFVAQRGAMPASTHWVPVPGGIHMYFGSFVGGGYKEEWAPRITREAQHERVVAATLEALQAMGGPG
ncbi:MAG: alpha/beta fold hydrolase [Steroidobacteraceae bacterium]